MAEIVSRRRVGVVIMHAKGSPADMQENPSYDDVIHEIKTFLAERVSCAERAGIARDRIIVDPGMGFGKTGGHNLEILRRAEEFRGLGVPVMVGPSRKRFIGQILGIDDPKARDTGTLAAVAACVLAGVELIRVHDVAACRQVADLSQAIRG
jgi:dihydropteroate synthase